MAKPFVYATPAFKPCGHPGCEVKMQRGDNTYNAGFCRKHGGMRKGRATVAPVAPAPEPEPAKVGFRVALVPYPTSNSGCPGMARVSLVREPWA